MGHSKQESEGRKGAIGKKGRRRKVEGEMVRTDGR